MLELSSGARQSESQSIDRFTIVAQRAETGHLEALLIRASMQFEEISRAEQLDQQREDVLVRVEGHCNELQRLYERTGEILLRGGNPLIEVDRLPREYPHLQRRSVFPSLSRYEELPRLPSVPTDVRYPEDAIDQATGLPLIWKMLSVHGPAAQSQGCFAFVFLDFSAVGILNFVGRKDDVDGLFSKLGGVGAALQKKTGIRVESFRVGGDEFGFLFLTGENGLTPDSFARGREQIVHAVELFRAEVRNEAAIVRDRFTEKELAVARDLHAQKYGFTIEELCDGRRPDVLDSYISAVYARTFKDEKPMERLRRLKTLLIEADRGVYQLKGDLMEATSEQSGKWCYIHEDDTVFTRFGKRDSDRKMIEGLDKSLWTFRKIQAFLSDHPGLSKAERQFLYHKLAKYACEALELNNNFLRSNKVESFFYEELVSTRSARATVTVEIRGFGRLINQLMGGARADQLVAELFNTAIKAHILHFGLIEKVRIGGGLFQFHLHAIPDTESLDAFKDDLNRRLANHFWYFCKSGYGQARNWESFTASQQRLARAKIEGAKTLGLDYDPPPDSSFPEVSWELTVHGE